MCIRDSVSAVNVNGEGYKSLSTAFRTYSPPAKVTLSSAEATKKTGQVELKWTTPANNGGEITAVQILYNGNTITLDSSNPNLFTKDMKTPGTACSYVAVSYTHLLPAVVIRFVGAVGVPGTIV